MQFNSANLLAEILIQFNSRSAFADAMGISRASLQKKLKDGSFTLFEINKALSLLGIPEEQFGKYFHFF